MGRTYVDYVRQQLNRMQTIRNELESVHRDAEVRSEPLTSNRDPSFFLIKNMGCPLETSMGRCIYLPDFLQGAH